tara:strand:+ start:198 stop:476 length:279 start_codon:yes stop_codon:yes gene_type:complete
VVFKTNNVNERLLNKQMKGKLGLNQTICQLRPFLSLRRSIPTVLFAMMVTTMLFIGEPPYAMAGANNNPDIKTAQQRSKQNQSSRPKYDNSI